MIQNLYSETNKIISVAKRISKRYNRSKSIKSSLHSRFLDLIKNMHELPKWLLSKPVMGTAMAAVMQNAQAGEPVFSSGVVRPFGLTLPINNFFASDTAVYQMKLADLDGDADLDLIVHLFNRYGVFKGLFINKNDGTADNPK